MNGVRADPDGAGGSGRAGAGDPGGGGGAPVQGGRAKRKLGSVAVVAKAPAGGGEEAGAKGGKGAKDKKDRKEAKKKAGRKAEDAKGREARARALSRSRSRERARDMRRRARSSSRRRSRSRSRSRSGDAARCAAPLCRVRSAVSALHAGICCACIVVVLCCGLRSASGMEHLRVEHSLINVPD